jgi:hypothetical protein
MDVASSSIPMATYLMHSLHFGESTNIRLVEVLVDSSLDYATPISCKLHVVPLDHRPAYTALSYVWDNASVTKTILLDGEQFVVRENLWNFLNHRRATRTGTRDNDSYLWVDAISIDQGSIKERNHQAAIMGRIYSEAKMVIAWLSNSPPALVEALQALQRQFSDSHPCTEDLFDVHYKHFNTLQRTNIGHAYESYRSVLWQKYSKYGVAPTR